MTTNYFRMCMDVTVQGNNDLLEHVKAVQNAIFTLVIPYIVFLYYYIYTTQPPL